MWNALMVDTHTYIHAHNFAHLYLQIIFKKTGIAMKIEKIHKIWKMEFGRPYSKDGWMV